MNKKVNVILFLVIIFGFPIVLLLSSKSKHSIEEKRDLAVVPTFSSANYLNGTWTKQLDAYIDDHFPLRKTFISFTPIFNQSFGFHFKNDERLFVVNKSKKQVTKDKEREKKDTLTYLNEFEESFSGSLLILNGCVYPLNGGSAKMAKSFAQMVNEYARNFPSLRVFSVVAPHSSAFIPVQKYSKYNSQNKRTLLAIKENLHDGAIFSDVFEELNNHSKTKLYFGTDHHWKPIGAYYAYVAFCKSAGIKYIELKDMIPKVKYNFVGTMYQYTKDPSVKAHPDTMEYWEPRVTTDAVYFGKTGTTKSIKSSVFYSSCSGGNTYSTFLGGDHPLMRITTSIKNGRRAVVIKNSMGNAFTVYLISHYEEIWVVDLRYSKQNLTTIIKENKINDLIFAVGMYAAMSDGTIGMMRRLATQSGNYKESENPQDPKPSSSEKTPAVLTEEDSLK